MSQTCRKCRQTSDTIHVVCPRCGQVAWGLLLFGWAVATVLVVTEIRWARGWLRLLLFVPAVLFTMGFVAWARDVSRASRRFGPGLLILLGVLSVAGLFVPMPFVGMIDDPILVRFHVVHPTKGELEETLYQDKVEQYVREQGYRVTSNPVEARLILDVGLMAQREGNPIPIIHSSRLIDLRNNCVLSFFRNVSTPVPPYLPVKDRATCLRDQHVYPGLYSEMIGDHQIGPVRRGKDGAFYIGTGTLEWHTARTGNSFYRPDLGSGLRTVFVDFGDRGDELNVRSSGEEFLYKTILKAGFDVAPSAEKADMSVSATFRIDGSGHERSFQLALLVQRANSSHEVAEFFVAPERSEGREDSQLVVALQQYVQNNFVAAMQKAAEPPGDVPAIEVAGRVLVAISEEDKSPGTLFAIELPGGEVRRVVEFHPRGNLALTSDKSRLAFLDVTGAVRVIDASTLRVATPVEATRQEEVRVDQTDFLAWSPSSEQLAVVRDGDLHLLDQVGGGMRLLATAHSAYYRQSPVLQRTGIATPVWTADGRGILYADFSAPERLTFPPGAQRDTLYRLDVSTGNARPVGVGARLRSFPLPGWCFAREPFGQPKLLIDGVGPAEAQKRLADQFPGSSENQPVAISNDQRRLVSGDGEAIQTTEIAAGDRRMVRRLRPTELAWSPTDDAIAYVRSRPTDKEWRFIAIRPDGRTSRLLGSIRKPTASARIVLFDWVK